MAALGYRRYCSLECRAACWRLRHPDRGDCGAKLDLGPDRRQSHCSACQPTETVAQRGIGDQLPKGVMTIR